MASFMDICLRIPNLGTILFLIVFVVAIPVYLYTQNSVDTFKFYLPFLVMLAVTLTEAGKPHSFNNLYPLPAKNLPGFLSTSMINGLAVVGLLMQCVGAALYYNSLELGVLLGVVTFAITFPFAQQVLPFFIREGDKVLKENTNFIFPGNWHRYFLGFAFILFLLGLEYVLIAGISQQVFSTGKSNNNIGKSLNMFNLN